LTDEEGADVERLTRHHTYNPTAARWACSSPKLGRGGEQLTIGQWFSLKGRKAVTKHVFVGATRVASKLLPPPGWDAPVPETDPATIPGCTASDFQPRKCAVPPLIEPKVGRKLAGFTVKPATYYYHPDHLGSTSWVTDQNGKVHEHAEYFPYGEVWRDPRSDSESSPVQGQQFLFTGKELDEETGLYYFGARYYDPVRARWASADPALGGYLEGSPNGGVFGTGNLSLYAYVQHNPLVYVDPDGLFSWKAFGKGVLKGAVVGVVVGASAAALIATGGTAAPLIGYGLVAVGAFTTGVTVGELATNTDTFSGRELTDEQWSERAGVLVGGTAGGIGGARLGGARTSPMARGRISEARVLEDMGLPKNTTPVQGREGESIPDFMNPREVGEIKDVAVAARTRQIRIQQEVAKDSGRRHTVITGDKTKVTDPLLRTSNVLRRPDLGPGATGPAARTPTAVAAPPPDTERGR